MTIETSDIEPAELVGFIRAEMTRFAVPGLAVAVVHQGEVVVCEGFGSADLDGAEPVTPETHFPLASDSKAFTAATLCVLAEAGRLDLDAPVRATLPWFAFTDPNTSALVSTRDLLSHRTGLPRHDAVWWGDSALSLEDITRSIRHLEVSRPLRAEWDYNNLCYIAAGHLTEAVTGLPWQTAVREILLEPLEMTQTVFSVQDPSIKRLALPYKAKADVPHAFELQPLPAKATADKAGPAGGLVSTIDDLALWLKARLGLAPTALPVGALQQLHKPAMLGGITFEQFPEVQSLGYALGCQVESYRGTRLVHHGGNIPGYSSDVCVVPGRGIGVAVLSNRYRSLARLPLLYGLLDRLLNHDPLPWGERIFAVETSLNSGRAQVSKLRRDSTNSSGTESARLLAELAGAYEHPAYGRFTVSVRDGRLVPHFHDADDRLVLRHRRHDAWDLYFEDDEVTCPLVFEQGLDGRITSLAISLEEQVAAIRFVRVNGSPPGLVNAVLGEYEMGPNQMSIRLRGAELVATIPSLGELVLAPGGGYSFVAPTRPGTVVTFETDRGDRAIRAVVDGVGVFVQVSG